MSRTLNAIIIIISIVVSLTILGGLVWANTLFVRNHPGEKAFLVPWLAARTFLQYGNNPYDEPASQRAEILYYGRLSLEGEDPLQLNVPFPIELFYFPFALIPDYALARGLWMTVLEISLVSLGFLSLRLTEWKPGRLLTAGVMIFSVLWVYGFLPLENGHTIIFVTLAITGLLLAVRQQRDELAGALMVAPFFAPEIAGVFVLFMVFWIACSRRWRILAGFFMMLVMLSAISFLILPNWFLSSLQGAITHINFNPGTSPGSIMGSWWPYVGPRLGWGLTAVLLVVLLVEWRAARKKDFQHMLWTACLSLSLAPLLGIPISMADEEVLFLPLILFLAILNERWPRPGHTGAAGITLIAFFGGTWLLFLGLSTSGFIFELDNALFLFLPMLTTLGLYWMRWWAVQPPRTWSDSLP